MFFQGFLIGLVAGVWLTVVNFVITTRGESIKSYVRALRAPSSSSSPDTQSANTVPLPIAYTPQVAATSRPTTPESSVSPAALKDLDLMHLSPYGAATYNQLTRLTHDEETAQRLVQYEASLRPNADIDELIDTAVDKLLRDRG